LENNKFYKEKKILFSQELLIASSFLTYCYNMDYKLQTITTNTMEGCTSYLVTKEKLSFRCNIPFFTSKNNPINVGNYDPQIFK